MIFQAKHTFETLPKAVTNTKTNSLINNKKNSYDVQIEL
jgi:hypothetical protein